MPTPDLNAPPAITEPADRLKPATHTAPVVRVDFRSEFLEQTAERERAETVEALRRIPPIEVSGGGGCPAPQASVKRADRFQSASGGQALAPVTDQFRREFFEATVEAGEKHFAIAPTKGLPKAVRKALEHLSGPAGADEVEKDRAETVAALRGIPAISPTGNAGSLSKK
jgi:hypothetical protein